jgi:thiol-disulfide isomerase/thioredoxin
MSRHQAARHPKPIRKPVSRTPAWVTPVAVVAAIPLLLVGFLLIRWYTTPLAAPPLSVDAAQSLVSAIASLPATELDSVGKGSANNVIKPVSGAALTGPTGKPMVFYFGAEYCPYCAAERWPLIVALSRFGTFSGLKTTSSSSSDVYPNTATFTFHGATFTSQYIDFQAVETSDRNQNPLETPTAAQQSLVAKYDTSGSIPFIDLGNRYAAAGAMYLPDILSGMSWQAIADALAQPQTPQAMAILGSANLITATVCQMTGNQPAAVCSSASVQGIEKQLG